MAGTLLAVELVKEHLGRPVALGDHHRNPKFQFENPTADRNGRATTVQRDRNCSACVPDGPGVQVWSRRWQGYGSARVK